jgi:hypothetical protein
MQLAEQDEPTVVALRQRFGLGAHSEPKQRIMNFEFLFSPREILLGALLEYFILFNPVSTATRGAAKKLGPTPRIHNDLHERGGAVLCGPK